MQSELSENARQGTMVSLRPIKVGRREYQVMRRVSAKGRPIPGLFAFWKDRLVSQGYTRAELVRGIEESSS